MKKKLLYVLVLISILAMFASVAAAKTPVKSMTLSGVYYAKNQLMIDFKVTGFTTKETLPAGITVNKINYPLFCSYDGVNHVKCMAPNFKRLKGSSSVVWVAGFIFYPKLY